MAWTDAARAASAASRRAKAKGTSNKVGAVYKSTKDWKAGINAANAIRKSRGIKGDRKHTPSARDPKNPVTGKTMASFKPERKPFPLRGSAGSHSRGKITEPLGTNPVPYLANTERRNEFHRHLGM